MMERNDRELEAGAAYLAGTEDHEWNDLPEVSIGWFGLGPSKQKYRDRVLAAEEYTREVNARYDKARRESDKVRRRA